MAEYHSPFKEQTIGKENYLDASPIRSGRGGEPDGNISNLFIL